MDSIEKRRKNTIIVSIVLLIILFIVIIALAIKNAIYSAELEIKISPVDAEIQIDGTIYKNGKYKFKPGQYHLSASAQGLKSFEEDIELRGGEKREILECMKDQDGNTTWAEADSNSEDWQICFAYLEKKDLEENKTLYGDKIFSSTPYKNYNMGIEVYSSLAEDQKQILVSVEVYGCSEEIKNESMQNFREWAQDNELNLENYKITYKYPCDEPGEVNS